MFSGRKNASKKGDIMDKNQLDAFNTSYNKYYGFTDVAKLRERVATWTGEKAAKEENDTFASMTRKATRRESSFKMAASAKIGLINGENRPQWNLDSLGDSNPLIEIFVKSCNNLDSLINFDKIVRESFSKNKVKLGVDGIYVDLLMHEKPELFEAALSLLSQRYFLKRHVWDELKVITVVGTAEDVGNKSIQAQMRQLSNDTTSFELWARAYKVIQANKQKQEGGAAATSLEEEHSPNFQRSLQTLYFLSRLCGVYGDSSIPEGQDLPEPAVLEDVRARGLNPSSCSSPSVLLTFFAPCRSTTSRSRRPSSTPSCSGSTTAGATRACTGTQSSGPAAEPAGPGTENFPCFYPRCWACTRTRRKATWSQSPRRGVASRRRTSSCRCTTAPRCWSGYEARGFACYILAPR
jgi:hypothetical protein